MMMIEYDFELDKSGFTWFIYNKNDTEKYWRWSLTFGSRCLEVVLLKIYNKSTMSYQQKVT